MRPDLSRPDRQALSFEAIRRHRATLDTACDRLGRAVSVADRSAAFRAIEASMADLGKYLGAARRAALLHQRAHGKAAS